MGIIEVVYTFIQDKNIRLSRKLFYFALGLVIFLGVDYSFRFSDSYITEKKIEQLEKIYKLREIHKLTSKTNIEISKIENEILRRQGFWSLSSDFVSLIQQTINSPKQKNATNNNANPIEIENKKVKTRSTFWHIISSSWWLILLIFILPIGIITDKNQTGNKLTIFIVGEIFITILIVILSYLTALIPTFKNPMWNYVLNMSLPLIIIIPIVISEKRKKKYL